MKVLLVSVNASYMHTNLAIRCLKTYADKFIQSQDIEIQIAEYTINQPVGEVLRGIGFTNANVILFSTYIWNAEYICKIIPDIKKILPNAIIGAGGPEFSYGAAKYIRKLPSLDFVMFGEGENTLVETLDAIQKNNSLLNIKGLYIRSSKDKDQLIFTGEREQIKNLDILPFPYPEITSGSYDPDHKIYYYESTRGCPYSCAYCLSSIDKRVRFKSIDKVKQELKIFLNANIKLVKFVDRTYNLNPERYIEIWQFILDNHNGKTMFHFEIEAEYLSQEALSFLQKVPEGIMQFEIGVQSANKQTLRAVNRSDNIEIVAEKIKHIPRTIHQHLDLIAGLPHEDLASFGNSYDFVMKLKPDALQLGFLKVLDGTDMAEYASQNGWKWMETPAYETFSTPYLSFLDIAFLKDIEIATDAFWNKGTFSNTMKYLFRVQSPWHFMTDIVEYGRSKGAFLQARRELYWFDLLYSFVNEKFNSEEEAIPNVQLLNDLIRYDFVRSGKKGNFPTWYKHNYNKDSHRKLLEENNLLANTRIGFAITEYEEFSYDVTNSEPEKLKGFFPVLIKYKQ